MVRNAKTYNQEGSWVYNDAVEMQKAFDTTYDMLCRFSGLPGSENEGEYKLVVEATRVMHRLVTLKVKATMMKEETMMRRRSR